MNNDEYRYIMIHWSMFKPSNTNKNITNHNFFSSSLFTILYTSVNRPSTNRTVVMLKMMRKTTRLVSSDPGRQHTRLQARSSIVHPCFSSHWILVPRQTRHQRTFKREPSGHGFLLVSETRGNTKWMVHFLEHPSIKWFKVDDLGVQVPRLLGNHHSGFWCCFFNLSRQASEEVDHLGPGDCMQGTSPKPQRTCHFNLGRSMVTTFHKTVY